jgi:exodeoxyribonuclease VII small subunit
LAAGKLPLGKTIPFKEFPSVSKAAKASPSGEELPFEDALKKLETIVDAMESEDLPLEQLLGRFEEGARLAKLCQDRLAEAEVKVRTLEEGLGGAPVPRPAGGDDA